MDPDHRRAILDALTFIQENIDLDNILPFLVEKRILTVDKHELIDSWPTNSKKVCEFIYILIRCGPNAYDTFLQRLDSHDVMCRISTKIRKNYEEILASSDPGNNDKATHLAKVVDNFLKKTYHICEENSIDVEVIRDRIYSHVLNNFFHMLESAQIDLLTVLYVKDALHKAFPNSSIEAEDRFDEKCFVIDGIEELDTEDRFPLKSDPAQCSVTKPLKEWTAAEVGSWLKTFVTVEVADKFVDEDIDGDCMYDMNMKLLKSEFTGLSTGCKMKILKQRDKIKNVDPPQQASVSADVGESRVVQGFEFLRKFDTPSSAKFKYLQGHVVGREYCHMDISNRIDPIHNFALLAGCKSLDLQYLSLECAKFACACLNERTNGTLHFGVDPKTLQIEGVELSQDQMKCLYELPQILKQLFYEHRHDVLVSCVRPPRLIEVTPIAENRRFVIEVDVCPTHCIVQGQAFFLSLSQKGMKKRKNYVPNKRPVLFKFHNGKPIECDGPDLKDFLEEIPRYDQIRKDKEEAYRLSSKTNFSNVLHRKLLKLLSRGTQVGVQNEWVDINPILVLGKSSADLDERTLNESFSFIKNIPWKAIFDFDAKGQICEFAQHKLDMTIKIQGVDSFGIESSSSQDNEENKVLSLQTDVQKSAAPYWIYLNGIPADGHDVALSPEQWKVKRERNFRECLRFYSEEVIPKDRGFVIFLILSKENDILIECMNEFNATFRDSWMGISDTEVAARPWIDALLHRHFPPQIEESIVIGMPWEHINDTIQKLYGPRKENPCFIPSSTGAPVDMTNNELAQLQSLSVLSVTECEQSAILDNPVALKALRQSEEIKFYKGGQVSWWNFWFHNQVCKRHEYEELKKLVEDKLRCQELNADVVQSVFLYHLPGAGGTTMVRMVLWELRKSFRCAVVHSIPDVEDVCENIKTFWSHKDEQGPGPILLLLDNIEDEKQRVLQYKLEAMMKQVCRIRGYEKSVSCVILVCKRLPIVTGLRSKEQDFLTLSHCLHPNDRIWFAEKSEKMKDDIAEAGVLPDYLISFNIMKENFDKTFIRKMVTKLLEGITDKQERQFLLYLSLLNSYDIEFRPIQTAPFHDMMRIVTGSQDQKARPFWEANLSMHMKYMLNGSHENEAHNKSLRLTNALLSDEVFHSLRKDEGLAISECILALLKNKYVFPARTPKYESHTILRKIISDVLIKRLKYSDEDGEFMHSKFSPLIEAIIKEELPDRAADVFDKAYQLIKNPFILQQLARLYISEQDWQQAISCANRATTINPDSSHLWDTCGRVYEAQLKEKRSSLEVRASTEDTLSELLSVKDVVHLLEICMKGKENFKVSQEKSDEIHNEASNTAGHYGELQITVLFLDCIKRMAPFNNDFGCFKRFLVDPKYLPAQFEELDKECQWDLKDKVVSLHEDYLNTLNRLEDEVLQLKPMIVADQIFKKERQSQFSILLKLKESLDYYFTEDSDIIPNGLSDEGVNLWKVRRVARRVGWNLRSIFQFVRFETLSAIDKKNKIDCLKKSLKIILENLEKPHKTTQCHDFFFAISISIALASVLTPIEHPVNYKQLVSWSEEFYRHRARRTIRLEAYMFYAMLNWPVPGRNKGLTASTLRTVIDQWRDAFYKKYPRQRVDGNKITTKYFLASGQETKSFMTHDQLQKLGPGTRKRKLMDHDEFWRSKKVRDALRSFVGKLVHDGRDVQMNIKDDSGSDSILTIEAPLSINNPLMFNKRVEFFIGFTWLGPKAYGVTLV